MKKILQWIGWAFGIIVVISMMSLLYYSCEGLPKERLVVTTKQIAQDSLVGVFYPAEEGEKHFRVRVYNKSLTGPVYVYRCDSNRKPVIVKSQDWEEMADVDCLRFVSKDENAVVCAHVKKEDFGKGKNSHLEVLNENLN